MPNKKIFVSLDGLATFPMKNTTVTEEHTAKRLTDQPDSAQNYTMHIGKFDDKGEVICEHEVIHKDYLDGNVKLNLKDGQILFNTSLTFTVNLPDWLIENLFSSVLSGEKSTICVWFCLRDENGQRNWFQDSGRQMFSEMECKVFTKKPKF